MKILVTGGAGFVGFHLTQLLSKQNNEITILDNLSNVSKEKLKPLLDEGVNFIEGNILDFNLLKKILNEKFDLVIHLAAKTDVEESFLYPDLVKEVNVKGTENLLKLCIENKIKNFIAASSAAVYGNSSTFPITENQGLNPISPYGESKAELEKIIQNYSQNHGINSVCLRFFNIFGKGQSNAYAGVITKFLDKIKKNKDLVIFGDGSYSRDFIYIDDVLDSIRCAIENIEGKRGNCYNIATGKPTTIKELANLILSIAKSKLEIKNELPKKGDISYSYANTELAKKDLKFKSSTKLKDGLKKLMDFGLY